MPAFIDLTGQRFGRLVVLDASTQKTPHGEFRWNCRCDCGAHAIATGSSLRSGKTQSCGCYRRESIASWGRANRTHGHASTKGRYHPLYSTWVGMRQRCGNPSNKGYKNYGGRGISVASEWSDFTVFLGYVEEHLGPRPAGQSLNRKDNNGNYEPGNVEWATPREQVNNQRARRTNAEVEGLAKLIGEVLSDLRALTSFALRAATREEKFTPGDLDDADSLLAYAWELFEYTDLLHQAPLDAENPPEYPRLPPQIHQSSASAESTTSS